ncbi:MAG: hypothetical protein QOE25_544, partial [Actinomycetota bacterium]|nr:hypothetical protein [Actinomycetota bacterium]
MGRRRASVGFFAVVTALSVALALLPSAAQAGKHHRADPEGIFKLDHL